MYEALILILSTKKLKFNLPDFRNDGIEKGGVLVTIAVKRHQDQGNS